MFEFKRGNTTYNFDFLIAFIVIVLVIFLIKFFFFSNQCKKAIKELIKGNYDNAIICVQRPLISYKKYNNRLSTKSIRENLDLINIVLAVAYFSKENYEAFLNCINSLTENIDVKHFWLSVYYFKKGDIDSAQSHCDNIKSTEATCTFRYLIAGLINYQNGKFEEAREKINAVYSKLRYPVLKEMADEVLSS